MKRNIKHTPGRHRLDDDEKTALVFTRVTESMKTALVKRAEKEGITFSEFIRRELSKLV